MPVFHTKTIESILEPVALQVNTDFLLLFIDNCQCISSWKRFKTVCCCFVHSSCDFPAIFCKFSHIYLLIFVTTTSEQIYLLNNLCEIYRFSLVFTVVISLTGLLFYRIVESSSFLRFQMSYCNVY